MLERPKASSRIRGGKTPMAISKRALFRNQALQAYARQRQKTVLPRYVTPPVFLLCWLILALLAGTTFTVGLARVPVHLQTSGIILADQQDSAEAMVVLFIPADAAKSVRVGQPVQVRLGPSGPQVSSTIAAVDTTIFSPSAARERYGLTGDLAQIITQPSMVATVRLGSIYAATTYGGSLVQSQVQIGTRSILSLLPFFQQAM
jgi:hypothetical protein